MVPNPIFTGGRHPNLVFLAGIVGVPFQLIARDPADLTKGFKDGSELSAKDTNGDSAWDKILGDPAHYVPPKDPHMLESLPPRVGLPPPFSPPDADPIHGHEYTIPANNDLQYACVFDLPMPRDCANPANVSCDCDDPMNDNPLCDPAMKTMQVKAKGYPGIRELAALRSVGSQGVVASICPKQLKDAVAADYGYRPASRAIVERLKGGLGTCDPMTTCAGVVSAGGAEKLCDGSPAAEAYAALYACACLGACAVACGDNACKDDGTAITAACLTCLGAAGTGCGDRTTSCLKD